MFEGEHMTWGTAKRDDHPVTLQAEAGYIDARPQSRQIDENLLRRTAGPYIWVNRDG
jgi:hypothetical protein